MKSVGNSIHWAIWLQLFPLAVLSHARHEEKRLNSSLITIISKKNSYAPKNSKICVSIIHDMLELNYNWLVEPAEDKVCRIRSLSIFSEKFIFPIVEV